MRALGSFYKLAIRRIWVRMPRCQNGRWEYPLISKELAEAGMESIGEYISCRHTSVAKYLSTRPIFDMETRVPIYHVLVGT